MSSPPQKPRYVNGNRLPDGEINPLQVLDLLGLSRYRSNFVKESITPFIFMQMDVSSVRTHPRTHPRTQHTTVSTYQYNYTITRVFGVRSTFVRGLHHRMSYFWRLEFLIKITAKR